MNIEALCALDALQVSKPFQRDLGCTRDELQQLCSLRLVQRSDRTPEPLDHWLTVRVTVQLSVVLPLVHVDVGQSRDEQLELLLRENPDQLDGNDVVETFEESINLWEANDWSAGAFVAGAKATYLLANALGQALFGN